MLESHIKALVEAASGLSPEELLTWAAERFGPRLAFASSLGAEDQVLTDMIARVAPSIAIFTIDTGRLPQETHDLLESTRKRYGRPVEVLLPDRAELEHLLSERGPNSFRLSVEDRRYCCQLRKVRPLRRRLAGLDAWISGLRREQSVTRTDIGQVEWDVANGLVKVSPLADWAWQQVWDYIRAHDVPYSVLHDRGYPSIGCAPCTRAVEAGEGLRAGRWWWELPEHKECGLHAGGQPGGLGSKE